MIDQKLLEILVCPVTKGPLVYEKARQELVSKSARLAAVALVAIYLTLTIGAAIKSEESHLTEKFGRAYPEYREGRSSTAPRRFSLARAWRNREYRSLAGVVAALALLLWTAL